MANSRILLALLTTGSLVACGEPLQTSTDDPSEGPGFRKQIYYLEAPCQVNVEGVGMVDVEEAYIPGVVSCENPNAGPEGLKAQAVEARSFLYYKLFVAGATSISNSQGDQVYSCSYQPNGPKPEHFEAARATKGQYLQWENQIVASFYVAGTIPPNPDAGDPYGSCLPNGGNDPTNTQRWVTYNLGKTGCDIDMTNLGFTPADCRGNPHNRGCASQNGHTCLDAAGVPYQEQFKFFYGDDIELVVADGRCGGGPILSPEDQFCTDNGDGAHCFDADTRIDCAGGAAAMTEVCELGCAMGGCAAPPPMGVCAGQPDGALCDGPTLLTCVGGEVSMSEVCQNGCVNAACDIPPAGNNGTVGNNGTGETNGGSDDGGDEMDDDETGAPDGSGLPALVGPSPGVEGGCSTSGNIAPTSLFLLFGLLPMTRRRRRP